MVPNQVQRSSPKESVGEETEGKGEEAKSCQRLGRGETKGLNDGQQGSRNDRRPKWVSKCNVDQDPPGSSKMT